MPAYLVAYDLIKRGQDYPAITTAITSFSHHMHLQGSVWVVVAEESAYDVSERLKEALDKNDKLIVAELTRNSVWTHYPLETSYQLERYLQA